VVRILPFLVAFLLITSVSADDKKDKEPGLTSEEKKILELTNKARQEEKLPPLKLNAVLVKVARAHSANMAKHEEMAHELDGKNPSQRIKDSGYVASWGGENVAMTNADTPEAIFKMWMDSAPHQANILKDKYEEIGVGIGRNAKGEIYYTQVFATPKKKR
jgi:uncharacterized protein YkwD